MFKLGQMKNLLSSIDVGRHATASGEAWQVLPLTDEQKALSRAAQVTPLPHDLKILPAGRARRYNGFTWAIGLKIPSCQ